MSHPRKATKQKKGGRAVLAFAPFEAAKREKERQQARVAFEWAGVADAAKIDATGKRKAGKTAPGESTRREGSPKPAKAAKRRGGPAPAKKTDFEWARHATSAAIDKTGGMPEGDKAAPLRAAKKAQAQHRARKGFSWASKAVFGCIGLE